MTLAPGTAIGEYQVKSLLGKGGMGEVYRAHDTKLQRDVALKILPAAFADDPDRLARFEREARALAALNHPNIAHIYGLEDFTNPQSPIPNHFLVMELVEGDDLAVRLAGGPLPVKTAVTIAIAIARALDAAHARQIVHRDLKPANIKIRPDGAIKLLDFGIAKVFAEVPPEAATVAPAGATEVGGIVGTPAYMSPEQRLGQTVDKRTDVWAFGCVLYEMLTGRTAFRGVGDVDWDGLPRDTPPSVRRVLRRCLAPDHDRRLADIVDARLELEDTTADEGDRTPARTARPLWPAVAAAAVIGTLIGAAVVAITRRPPPIATAPVMRLAVLPPPGERLLSGVRAMAIAPDGSRIVMATDRGLYLRALDGVDMRRLSATVAGNMAFSPDGSRLAFMGFSGVQTIDVSTGATETLTMPTANLGGVIGSLSWTDSGLVGAFGAGGVWALRKGAWEQLVRLEPAEATSNAHLLPDGAHVLMTVIRLTDRQRTGTVVVQDLKTGARTTVAERASDATYFAGAYIVYVKDGVLLAHPFDVSALKPTGDAVRIVEGVQSANIVNATMQYALSATGTLAYVPGQAMPPALAMDLVIADRRGRVDHLHLPPAPYETPRMSPDGRMFAVSTDDGREASVWVRDLPGEASIRRLTIGGRNRFPVWSPDGKRIAFQSDREQGLAIVSQAADGSDAPARLTTPEAGVAPLPESWSATHLLYSAVRGDSVTLWAYAFGDKRSTQIPGVASMTPISATFSPDGRWIAYNTTGTSPGNTTYIRPFPPTDEVHEISARDQDGHHPVWSRDGHELIYIPGPRRLFAVKVQFAPAFSFSPPETLPQAGLMGPGDIPRNFDILPDGMRFIGREIAEDEKSRAGAPRRIEIVTNLREAIAKQR